MDYIIEVKPSGSKTKIVLRNMQGVELDNYYQVIDLLEHKSYNLLMERRSRLGQTAYDKSGEDIYAQDLVKLGEIVTNTFLGKSNIWKKKVSNNTGTLFLHIHPNYWNIPWELLTDNSRLYRAKPRILLNRNKHKNTINDTFIYFVDSDPVGNMTGAPKQVSEIEAILALLDMPLLPVLDSLYVEKLHVSGCQKGLLAL